MTRKALTGVWVAFVLGLVGCSEAECTDGERKVGTVCVKTTRTDAGADSDQGDGTGRVATSPDGSITRPRRQDAGGGSDEDGSKDDSDEGTSLPASDDTGMLACEELACEPSTVVACATACRTNGSAICPERCTAETELACTPPAETCNGQDDDCDGIVDANLAERLPDGARVWTAAGAAGMGNLTVVAKAGGAWVASRAAATSALRFDELDAHGKATGKNVSAARTKDMGAFALASDGKWVALLATFGKTADANLVLAGTLTLQVQLYRAADLSFVDQFTVVPAGEVQCGTLAGMGIDVHEDAGGNVALALSRVLTSAPITDSTCNITAANGATDLLFLSYAKDKTWTPIVRGLAAVGATFIGGYQMHVAKVPCRDEWLAGYSAAGGRALRHYSFAGRELGNLDRDVEDSDLMMDLEAYADSCADGGSVKVAMAYGRASDPYMSVPHVRRWTLRGTPADLLVVDDFEVLNTPSFVDGLSFSGGRMFWTGFDEQVVPRVLELAPNSATAREVAVQALTTRNASSSDLQLRQYLAFLGGGLGFRIVELVDTGSALVLGTSQYDVLTTGLDGARQPGDNNPPVGVTYRLGCAD